MYVELQEPVRVTTSKAREPFHFFVLVGEKLYQVSPLPLGDAGERVWRFRKPRPGDDEMDTYHVHVHNGVWACECRGHLQWGFCRHQDVIKALCKEFTV